MSARFGQGRGSRGSLRANAASRGKASAFRQVVKILNFLSGLRQSRTFRDSHGLPGAIAPVALCAVICLALPRMLAADDAVKRAKPTLESVGEKVYCLCGCVTTLNRCPHLPSECSSRAQMEELIKGDVAQGKDEAAILQELVQRYGVQVLAAPPAKGFDLAVWVLPGFGLVAGLVLVVWLVRRWRRPPGYPPEPPAPVDPKLMMAIEEEMKTLED